jgi:hypothetical protein
MHMPQARIEGRLADRSGLGHTGGLTEKRKLGKVRKNKGKGMYTAKESQNTRLATPSCAEDTGQARERTMWPGARQRGRQASGKDQHSPAYRQGHQIPPRPETALFQRMPGMHTWQPSPPGGKPDDDMEQSQNWSAGKTLARAQTSGEETFCQGSHLRRERAGSL